MLSTYQPSNRYKRTDFIIILLAIICGGLLCGIIAFALSRVLWLTLVFPAGFGFCAGVTLAQLINRRKLRSPGISVVCALIMGLVLYITFHYLSFVVFQQSMNDELHTTYGITDANLQRQAMNDLLLQRTGAGGFWGYMKFQAQEGVSIGRLGFARAVTLNEPLTWLYWAIEVGCIVGVASIISFEAANKPFCESCSTWYRGGIHIGSVAADNQQQFIDIVQTDNFERAGALIRNDAVPPNLDIYLQQCSHPEEHDTLMSIRQTMLDSAGRLQFSEISERYITPQQSQDIRNDRQDILRNVAHA